MSENLMDFSIADENTSIFDEDGFLVPLAQTPVIVNSILKPSTKDNLIQLATPIHKKLKVHFNTPRSAKPASPAKFDAIRQLDDVENWCERTTVVTKCEHEMYWANAKKILYDLIESLPLEGKNAASHVECLNKENDDVGVCQPLSLEDLNEVHTSAEDIADGHQEDADNNSFNSDSTLVNSPDSDSQIDPFKPTSQIMNSPVPLASNADDGNIVSESIADTNNHVDKPLDSLDTNNHLFGSENPDCTSEASISGSEGKSNMQELADNSSPSADTDTCGDNGLLEDPFTPKSQLNNSFSEESSSSVSGLNDSIDPFITSQKVPNSPACKVEKNEDNELDVDPFKSRTMILNSPPLVQNKDSDLKPQNSSFESTSDLVIPVSDTEEVLMSGLTDSKKPGTPGILEETFVAMGNSLETLVDADCADSFELGSNVSNFVQTETNIDSENINVCVTTLGNDDSSKLCSLEDAINKQDTFESNDGLANSASLILDDFENEDPFKSKFQIQNSPISCIENEMDPFEQKSKVTNSPEIAAVDPFNTVPKILSFPPTNENEDEEKESGFSNSLERKPTNISENEDEEKESRFSNSLERKPTNISENEDEEKESRFSNSLERKPTNISENEDEEKESRFSNSLERKPTNISENEDEEKESRFSNSLERKPTNISENEDEEKESRFSNSLERKPTNISENEDEEKESRFSNSLERKPTNISENEDEEKESRFSNSLERKPTNISENEDEEKESRFSNSLERKPTNISENEDEEKESRFSNSLERKPTNISENEDEEKESRFSNSLERKPTNISENEDEEKESRFSNSLERKPTNISENEDEEKESGFSNSLERKLFDCTDDLDPFECKSKVGNSPEIGTVANSNSLASIYSEFDDLSTTMTASPERTREAEKSSDTVPNQNGHQPSAFLDMLETGQGFFKVQEERPFDLPPPLTDSSNFTDASDLVDMGNEIFYPASQVFSDPASFDMLEQFGKVECASECSLSRISLYVKFDPLVTEARGKTPNKHRISLGPKQIEILKELGNMDDNILLFGTPPKNMKIAPLSGTPRSLKKDAIGNKADDKLNETAKKPIVDLFMCSPEEQRTQPASENGTCWELLEDDLAGTDGIVEVLKYSEKDWRAMVARMKMQFQGQTLRKEKEWCLALSEKQMSLEASQSRVQEKEKDFSHMKLVIAEYEKIINEMIAEKEKCKTDSKESLIELKKERDEALQDLQSVEKAFADLHRRYENAKSIVDGFKKNEESLKSCLDDNQSKVIKFKEMLQSLKKDAEEKLEKANKEIERLHTHSQSEKMRCEALVRRKEMQIHSIEKNIEQKTDENKELIELLDSMMAKLENN